MHESECRRAFVVNQARAKDEGEQPEDDDEQDLYQRNQDEQDDVDRD